MQTERVLGGNAAGQVGEEGMPPVRFYLVTNIRRIFSVFFCLSVSALPFVSTILVTHVSMSS